MEVLWSCLQRSRPKTAPLEICKCMSRGAPTSKQPSWNSTSTPLRWLLAIDYWLFFASPRGPSPPIAPIAPIRPIGPIRPIPQSKIHHCLAPQTGNLGEGSRWQREKQSQTNVQPQFHSHHIRHAKLSSPCATGPAGQAFEVKLGAACLTLLLTGGAPLWLGTGRLRAVHLQAAHLGVGCRPSLSTKPANPGSRCPSPTPQLARGKP
jgi:hypothetical protein